MTSFRLIASKIFGARDEPEALPEFDLRIVSKSDVGMERDHNEDAVLFKVPTSPREFTRQGAIAILADGMGGHAAGEVASQLACSTICSQYYEGHGSASDILHDAIQNANSAIFKAAQKNALQRGMGTTCTALLIVGGHAHYAWVGDSRIYLIRDKSLYRLSEDHTIVNDMVKDGLLDAAAAAKHPDRNVLSRALGTRQKVEVSTSPQPLDVHIGDRFVLCSDGLHDLVPEDDLLRICTSFDETRATQSLIALANQLGGSDNISVIIVHAAPRCSVPPPSANQRETREFSTT